MKLKSYEPYWLIKNGLPYSYPSLKKDIQTDIVIIGGGITGSLIAHQCISEGYKTIIIDKRDIGNGSTSATTSMLQYEIDVPLINLIAQIGRNGAIEAYNSCYEAINKLEKICKEIGTDVGFERKISLQIASNKKDTKWMQEEYEVRKSINYPVKWLNSEEINNKFNIYNNYGGILSNHGASVDAYKLCHELIHFNKLKGLEVFDKTNIKKYKITNRGINIVTDKHLIIKAQKAIFCNGFESTELIKEKFVDLISTYAIVSECYTEAELETLNKLLVWNTTQPYSYLRTTSDNRILIGGEDEEFANEEKRDELLEAKALELEKIFKSLLPNIGFHTDYKWAGTFGTTPDGLPFIGTHPDFKNCYFVLGFGGNGITFSVTGMEMVSNFLKDKPHPLTPLFNFERLVNTE
jgi:glycine/D-amino acid oxidase-like deaminating enzyme